MREGTVPQKCVCAPRWPLLFACVGIVFLPPTLSAAFQERDWTQLRREAIEAAVAGKDPTAVVELVVRGRQEAPGCLALRILGKKALPHLYEILSDDEFREPALRCILLVIDPTDRKALEELRAAAARAETKDDWAEVRALRGVIEASQLNSAEQREARLTELQQKFPPGDGLSPERLALCFPATQRWALRRAETRLKDLATTVR